MAASAEDARDTLRQFREAVNMPASAIERWLRTHESREVGFKHEAGGESVGHQSGRRIVGLLQKRAGDYSSADYAHMRKVVGYVHRHLAQRPHHSGQELEHTRWRYSLMNWGHDPIKPGGKGMSTAKKGASRKAAGRKSASKKAASGKSAGSESAAKKSAARKGAAKKAAARKTPAKKAAGRKTASKKAAGKKATSKKTTSKKAAGKTTAGKTTTARKATARKATARKAGNGSANGKDSKTFSSGDKVSWTTSQGETEGVVEKKLTGPMKIKQHQVAASPENPEYLVRSSKSGGKAAHKPGSLRKR